MIYNQKLLIAIGIFFFAVAFTSSLFVVNYSWDNSWTALPMIGKISAVLMVVDLIWLWVSQFIKKR